MQFTFWIKLKSFNCGFRVINVLKKWVENHVHDFSLDVEFIKKFVVFLDEVVAQDNQKWAEHLKKIVEARILKSIVRDLPCSFFFFPPFHFCVVVTVFAEWRKSIWWYQKVYSDNSEVEEHPIIDYRGHTDEEEWDSDKEEEGTQDI